MKHIVMNDELYPRSDDLDQKLDAIKGKTLEVYYYLAKNQNVKFGVRQIQRELGYSSSSVAAYHLNRLVQHNLIQKTSGGLYYLESDPIKLGRLEDHILVAGRYIPKILFYMYHALISILVSIIFFFLDVGILFWFVYTVVSNLVFLIIIFRDAKKILNKIEQHDSEE